MTLLFPLPIMLLLLIHALTNLNFKAAVGGGTAVALTCYTGLYILGAGFITSVPIFIMLALEDTPLLAIRSCRGYHIDTPKRVFHKSG
jgi:hypothetical protein